MLWLLLLKYQPTATEDEAEDLGNDIGPRALGQIFRTASGSLRERPKNEACPEGSPAGSLAGHQAALSTGNGSTAASSSATLPTDSATLTT